MTLPLVLVITLIDSSYRNRSGGKPVARSLRKPIKPNTKRAAFLRWHLEDATGRTIGATMASFDLSRQNVITYWTTIHREHGIGYTLENNTITAILPADADPESVFEDAHQ